MTLVARDKLLSLYHGECIEVLKTLPDASIDACVTDPPYGLEFMGADWDTPGKMTGNFDKFHQHGKGVGAKSRGIHQMLKRPAGSNVEFSEKEKGGLGGYKHHIRFGGTVTPEGMLAFQLWTTEWAREVFRVLKPGGHLLSFGGTRTFHRMTVGLEDAGFEIRDCLMWVYGSGFPKSVDIAKAIDKTLGAKRTTVRVDAAVERGYHEAVSDEAVSDEAKKWQGWGSATKPSWEPVILARRPFDGTLAKNVLQHGTGGLNIDATRIGYVGSADQASAIPQGRATAKPGALAGGTQNTATRQEFTASNSAGRWPANFLMAHDPSCVLIGQTTAKSAPSKPPSGSRKRRSGFGMTAGSGGKGGPDGTEAVERWACVPGCPVRLLDDQAGPRKGMPVARLRRGAKTDSNTFGDQRAQDAGVVGYSDNGGPSRFFFTAKADNHERFGSMHPTVKPVALMEWLLTLVVPPDGVVLDPFIGSGTTLVAARNLGMKAIGIDKELKYIQDAAKRGWVPWVK